jgi:hypothetical protein
MSPFESSSATRRRLLGGACATTMLLAAPSIVRAQEQGVVKIGLIQSMTGPLNTIGKAVVDGARLYMQQHGDTVAGRKIQLIVKDDATSPEIAKRLAQEMIVNDKVAIICVGITPSALTIAPLVTEAKIPTLVMVSAASITVERSPYMVRTSFTLGQSASPSSPTGRSRTAPRRSSPSSTTGRPASKRKGIQGPHRQRRRRKSSHPCGCRSPIRTSRRSCSGRAISRPDTLFVVFPGKPGRRLRQTVPRARHGQVRHPLHRPPATSPTTTNSPA